MRMYDIINKKKQGFELDREEIKYAVNGYTAGDIGDGQMAALLMAIRLMGLNESEIFAFTDAMAKSGEILSFSDDNAVVVDKHSTGGVGDKTTLIVAPLAAALGVRVAKMSGRGLGHTGGTIDKLEAIPGFNADLSIEQFRKQLACGNVAIASQTANLAPADKKIYALRDVTATVDSLALIAASVMSKKLAAGADAILLDVKVGSGAFMKTLDEAKELASLMVKIGRAAGKPTMALITDMDTPLGYAVGNALEVREAVEVMEGRGPEDLRKICIALTEAMLELADNSDSVSLDDGKALKKFRWMIEQQGVQPNGLDSLPTADVIHTVFAPQSGYIHSMDSEAIGIAACILGAGRDAPDAAIDFAAGILLRKKTGDFAQAGEALAELHTSDKRLLVEAEKILLAAYRFSDISPPEKPLILARITS